MVQGCPFPSCTVFCRYFSSKKEKEIRMHMNTAQPIRSTEDLKKLKRYYKDIRSNERNQLLIIMGLNTALRISDILSLKWESVYDFDRKKFKSHIVLIEEKTGKTSTIFINQNIHKALEEYKDYLRKNKKAPRRYQYIFRHSNKNTPISRIQAFRIIKEAADYNNIPGIICCHSLRKTFGYHAWKQGASPVVLMNIFNHSSYQITKRYLGIEQDDRDMIFEQIVL